MGDEIVELRHAASLILLRPDRDSWLVLMGLRHAGLRFEPNRMVFPGGGVDAADFAAPAATELPHHVLAWLARAAGPDLARALGHAAARELAEETGLSLGEPPHLAGLHYLCRAETPANRPIRFNARFFVGEAGLASGTLAGSGELETLDWYPIKRILQRDLAAATRAVLDQLQVWLRLAPAARSGWNPPVLRDRAWQQD